MHSQNNVFLIDLTEEGMFILFNDMHPLKAESSMIDTDEGIINDVIDSHWKKENLPIDDIVDGIMILESFLQFLKQYGPIVAPGCCNKISTIIKWFLDAAIYKGDIFNTLNQNFI